jgi:hypothetical protein
MAVTICELNLTKLMLEKYHPTVLTDLGPTQVQLTLDDKQIIAVVDKDPLLQQKMVDAGQKVIRQAAEKLAKDLQMYDTDAQTAVKKSGKAETAKLFADGFKKHLERKGHEAGDNAGKAAEQVWKDLCKTKKDYSKYKWKTGFKITLGIVAAGGTIVGAVGSGLTGNVLGLVGSIAGTLKATSQTIQTIRGALKDASQIYVVMRKDLEVILNQYEEFDKTTTSKAKKTGQEVAAEFLDKFLTIQVKSLKKVESQLDLFRNKLKGIDVEAHKVSESLNKALLDWKKLDALLKTAPPALHAKVDKQLALLEVQIYEAITKIGKLMEEVNHGAENSKKIEKVITELKKDVNTGVVTAAKGFFLVAAAALDIFDAGVPSFGTILDGVAGGISISTTSLGVISDAVESFA